MSLFLDIVCHLDVSYLESLESLRSRVEFCGLAPLIALVHDGEAQGKAMAAGALCNLALNTGLNADEQAAIAAATEKELEA